MPIIASCVSYQKVVVAEDRLTPQSRPVVMKMLERLPRHDTRVSYQFEASFYHFMVENEIVYLCITDSTYQGRTVFGFLGDVRDKFKNQFAGSDKKYPAKTDLTPKNCNRFNSVLFADWLPQQCTNTKAADDYEECEDLYCDHWFAWNLGFGNQLYCLWDQFQQVQVESSSRGSCNSTDCHPSDRSTSITTRNLHTDDSRSTDGCAYYNSVNSNSNGDVFRGTGNNLSAHQSSCNLVCRLS